MTAIQYDSTVIKVKADDSQVTKADEIDIITQLHGLFADKQLYLTTLFTGRLTGWVTSCIKADVCPDVYVEWMHEKDKQEGNADAINDRNQQIHDLRIDLGVRELEINELKLTIGEREAGIERDALTIQKLKDQVADVAEERDDLAEGVLTYADEAYEHKNEINALKARLWDLTKEQLIKEWGTGGV
jgi:hypothetical protein